MVTAENNKLEGVKKEKGKESTQDDIDLFTLHLA